MDNKKGLVCGLTDEYADFEVTCDEFVPDLSLESKLKEKKSLYDGIEYEKTPYKYIFGSFSKMGWFVLLLFLGFALLSSKYYFMESNDAVYLKYFFEYASRSLFPTLTFLFIAIEIKSVKYGIISGLAYIVISSLIITFFSKQGFYTTNLLIMLPASFVAISFISHKLFNDLNKRILFILKATSIYIGLSVLNYGYMNFAEVLEFFSGLFTGYNYSGEFDKYNLLVIKYNISETGYSIINLKYFFVSIILSFLTYFMTISLYYQSINNKKWHDLSLDLGCYLSKWKVLIVIIMGYFGLILFATGIGGLLDSIINIRNHAQFSNNLLNTFNYGSYIAFFILLVTGILTSLRMIFYYRKFVLEYFLNHGKNISWRYYLSFIPIVGLFVWITNIFSFKRIKLNKSKLTEILYYQNSAFVFLYISLALIYYVLSIRSGTLEVLMNLSAIILLLIYVFHKQGVYINAGLRIILFLVFCVILLLSPQTLEFEIRSNFMKLISAIIFLPFFFQYLLHPIFHLSNYKITIPEEFKEENPEVLE